MGTWNAKISGNDTFLDICRAYFPADFLALNYAPAFLFCRLRRQIQDQMGHSVSHLYILPLNRVTQFDYFDNGIAPPKPAVPALNFSLNTCISWLTFKS